MLESIEQEKLRQGHEKIFKFSGQEPFGTGSRYSLGQIGIRCTTRDSPGRGGLIRWSSSSWPWPSWQSSSWWRGKHGWTSFKLWWCWWGHLCRWRKQCWSSHISSVSYRFKGWSFAWWGISLFCIKLHQNKASDVIYDISSMIYHLWYMTYHLWYRLQVRVPCVGQRLPGARPWCQDCPAEGPADEAGQGRQSCLALRS